MALLPERYHSSSPQRFEGTEERHSRPVIDLDRTEWRISVRRERSGWQLFLVLCIAGAVWLFWPTIRDILQQPRQPYAPPVQAPDHRGPAYGPGHYAQPGDPVGPDFENWGNRNHSGVTPRDIFGFNREGRH
jgi:hypothetical protein